MAESIVQDWLQDYQRIQGQVPEEATFATQHEAADAEISEAIYTIFNERQRHAESLMHDICQQLLAFYRSPEERLRKYPLQFIPILIYTYLHAVAAGDKKGARSVETLLICIYNTEVSTEDGGSKVVSFRMPILAQASVYHEEKNLPMSDLRRWEEHCNREVKWGPHTQVEAITAQNRLKVMTALMFCYNQQLSQTQKASLIHLCRVASQLVNQGFTKQGSDRSHRMSYGSDPPKSVSAPRIPLSSAFLIELVHSLYFAMFNGFGTVAIQTLDDIHQRACFEMYTELILVTSAVRNSLNANPSGQPCDGPMGLSVALTPATTTVTTAVSKSMITNASFRTKKLPDDIPIQVQDLTMQQMPLNSSQQSQQSQLASVAEEGEQTPANSDGRGGTTTTSSSKEPSSRNSIIRPSMEGIKAQAQATKALIAGFKKSRSGGGGDKDKEGKSAEPPKPPLRKFEQQQQQKHAQRSSLLQMQAEGNAMMMTAAAEQTNIGVGGGLRSKAHDSMDGIEVLHLQSLIGTGNDASGGGGGQSNFSIDSELNGSVLVNNNNSSSAAPSNTNSMTSSDYNSKSFDSSIELTPPPIGAGGGSAGKSSGEPGH